MSTANFTIYEDSILINNVTEIKEFSETIFIIRVQDTLYQISGENLVLKEVSNDNKTLKINGIVHCLEKKDKVIKKNKSFLKRLFA